MRIEDLSQHENFQTERFGRSVILTAETSVLFMYSFNPGQAMTDHTHPFSNEFILVVEGEAQISVGVETVLARPLSVVFAPKEVVHAIHNFTDKPLLVASFMAPKP